MSTDTPHYYLRYMLGATLIALRAVRLLDQNHTVALQAVWQYCLLVAGGAIRIIDP